MSRFEKICEVQSDKASIDITSPYEGIVLSVHCNAGDVVKVSEVFSIWIRAVVELHVVSFPVQLELFCYAASEYFILI